MTDILIPLLQKYALAGGRRAEAKRKNGIEDFIVFLASECDWANTIDWRGFGKAHVQLGHRLAALAHAGIPYTASERRDAAELATYYRGQLERQYDSLIVSMICGGERFRRDVAQEGALKPLIATFWEQTGKVDFNLPVPLRKQHGKEIISEVWALVKATGVSLSPSWKTTSDKLEKEWSREVKLTFHISDKGAPAVLGILKNGGFAMDMRLDDALLNSQRIVCRTDTHAVEWNGRRVKRLFAYLDFPDRRPEFESEIWTLMRRHRCGGFTKFVKPFKDVLTVNRFMIPVGDRLVDELEDIFTRHGVYGGDGPRRALDDPNRRGNQFVHLSLSNPQSPEPPRVGHPKPGKKPVDR